MASECTFDWALARLCDIRAAIRCDAGAMDTAMYFSRERQGFAGRMNGLAECGPDCEYAWARLKSSASAESADRRIAADRRIVVDRRIAADHRIVADHRIAVDRRIAADPRIAIMR